MYSTWMQFSTIISGSVHSFILHQEMANVKHKISSLHVINSFFLLISNALRFHYEYLGRGGGGGGRFPYHVCYSKEPVI